MKLRGKDGDNQVDTEADQRHPETSAGHIAHDGVKLVTDVVAFHRLRLAHYGCANITNVELLWHEGLVVVRNKQGVVMHLKVTRAELHLGAGLQILLRAGHVRLWLVYHWDSCGS